MIKALIARGFGFGAGRKYVITLGLSPGAAINGTGTPGRALVSVRPIAPSISAGCTAYPAVARLAISLKTAVAQIPVTAQPGRAQVTVRAIAPTVTASQNPVAVAGVLRLAIRLIAPMFVGDPNIMPVITAWRVRLGIGVGC